MNTNNTKAVIYARVSSQTDRQDTARQVADLKRFALGQDMEIVKTFEEHISGAKKLEEREILTQCLEYCKSNPVKYLLISELSRLGRSTLQVLRSLEILHEAKVCVYIQNIGLYSLQPNGEVNPVASIMITILAEMSNIERSNIQYRLNSGRQQYINRGGKLGRKKGSVKTADQKREEYKEVISLLKRGYSIRNVARLTGFSIQTVQTVKNQFFFHQGRDDGDGGRLSRSGMVARSTDGHKTNASLGSVYLGGDGMEIVCSWELAVRSYSPGLRPPPLRGGRDRGSSPR